MTMKYHQDEVVRFNVNGKTGSGRIVGMATNGAPVIGTGWIIAPDESIASASYPFSHFVAFESQLFSMRD